MLFADGYPSASLCTIQDPATVSPDLFLSGFPADCRAGRALFLCLDLPPVVGGQVGRYGDGLLQAVGRAVTGLYKEVARLDDAAHPRVVKGQPLRLDGQAHPIRLSGGKQDLPQQKRVDGAGTLLTSLNEGMTVAAPAASAAENGGR